MEDYNDYKKDAVQVNIRELVNDKCSDVKEVLLVRIKALESKMTSQQEASQRAIDRAEQDYNTRFASTNEWREAFKDREMGFASRSEHKAVEDKVALCITRSEHDALISEVNFKNDRLIENIEKKSGELEGKINNLADRQMVLLGGILLTLLLIVFELLGVHVGSVPL